MTEFEQALDECLRDLESGASNVQECLRRYPGHAVQLEPVLLTVDYLQHGREARPSRAFKVRVRTKLIQGMQSHPRKTFSFHLMFVRPAVSFLVILLVLLITGTAYAQSALPGDALYPWKLASEHAWRAITPDPMGTDLALADRRVAELIAVGDDPALQAQALKRYLEVTTRLKSERNEENEARIRAILEAQIEELHEAGIPVPGVDPEILPPLEDPLPTPAATLPPAPEIPQVNPGLPAPTPGSVDPTPFPEIPPPIPTDMPNVLPTVELPPSIDPTIELPTDIVPTVDLPPLGP